MKPFVLLISAILAACAPVRETLQTGDLIFVGRPVDQPHDPDSMEGAIASATADADGLDIIHAAIVEMEGDRVWIIDATIRHGVDRHPLDTFLHDFTRHDGSLPVFEVKRLRDDTHAAEYVENVKKYLGLPYDVHFLPDNGAMYCTELIYESYVTPDGTHLFHAGPMNFKDADGQIPAYWARMFAQLGQEVPQGHPGTNPEEMAKEPILRPVGVTIP